MIEAGGARRYRWGAEDIGAVHATTPGLNGRLDMRLFAAGWLACCDEALANAAAKRKTMLPAAMRLTSDIEFLSEGDTYILTLRIAVRLPELDDSAARQLVEDAKSILAAAAAVPEGIRILVTLDR